MPAPVYRETVTTMRTLVESEHPLVTTTREAFGAALVDGWPMPEELLALSGLSGRKYRAFINCLVRHGVNRYLEVGTYKGSTLCSAIHGNRVEAVAIDNFSLQFSPDDVAAGISPKVGLAENLERFRTPEAEVRVWEGDFRQYDFASLSGFTVYVYDGPHGAQDQYDGIVRAMPALADDFVFVVDDWNWEDVRKGTLLGIRDADLSWRWAAEIMTETMIEGVHVPPVIPIEKNKYFNQFSAWHNGYFIGVLSKRPA